MPDDFDYYSEKVLSEEEVEEIIANHVKTCTKAERDEYCKVCWEY